MEYDLIEDYFVIIVAQVACVCGVGCKIGPSQTQIFSLNSAIYFCIIPSRY
jgi:hypothetical protein